MKSTQIREAVGELRQDFKDCEGRKERSKFLLKQMWNPHDRSSRHLSNVYLRTVFGISSEWAKDLRNVVIEMEALEFVTLDAASCKLEIVDKPGKDGKRAARVLTPAESERVRIIRTVLELCVFPT
jgi:hypothetical protein